VAEALTEGLAKLRPQTLHRITWAKIRFLEIPLPQGFFSAIPPKKEDVAEARPEIEDEIGLEEAEAQDSIESGLFEG